MLTKVLCRRGAHYYRMDQGFVSVFIDSTEIEVNGKCFEGAKRSYCGVLVRCIRFLRGECFQGATDRLGSIIIRCAVVLRDQV